VRTVTLLFRIRIDGEVHEVRVEVPPGRARENLEELKEFVLTTAYLEHHGLLPRGVVNILD
jgi:hypothetical protein